MGIQPGEKGGIKILTPKGKESTPRLNETSMGGHYPAQKCAIQAPQHSGGGEADHDAVSEHTAKSRPLVLSTVIGKAASYAMIEVRANHR